ncbi:hypothetical protein KKG05_05270, partial [bacterium]|nr:hypothetical protein [bacterium]
PNWEDVLLDAEIVKGSYLYIIASNDLEDEAEELVTWRMRKGYTVEVAGPNEIGALSTSTIKSFIQGRYNSADPPLEFVCLLGDESGPFPVPTYFDGGVGDWNYSRLDGTDVLPDVHIGRLCFDTVDEFEWLVKKICNYEKYPAPPTGGSRNWYKGAGCIAGEPYGSYGISTVQTMRWNRERMLDVGYTSSSIDTVYHTNGTVDDDDITYSFNAGSSLICYRGGLRMESYAEDDIALQNNEMRLPFMVTISCGTNDFDDDSGTGAICELLLKAGSIATPKGVIGAIGTSSMGTHTRFNNCLMCGAIQGLLREGIHTMGGSLTRSKVELYLNYPVDPSYVEYFCQYESLLGDPAVDVFTDTPEQLYVDNPSTAPKGTNTLTLTVTGESAQPIEGAYVNLVKGTEVFAGDWTDASGQVVLNFETTSVDSLFVTATKHNFRPAINHTLITSSVRFVSPASSAFATVNPGEAVELDVTLKNWGTTLTAYGVEATLSITDPFVASISDGYEDYGNIGPGAEDEPLDGFNFTVADYAPDGYELRFELTVTDNVPNTWMSAVPITVSNGNFEYYGHTFSGVGDGILDPGETGEVYLRLDNIGARTIQAGTVGYLRSGNSAVVIDDSVGTFTSATPGSQSDNLSDKFGITATTNAFPGERVPMLCIFPLDDGFADTVYCSFVIGTVASTDPTPPDSHGYWAFDNTDVAYDKHPTYSWIEIDPYYGGSGDTLNIIDETDEGDATTAIALPFTFQYYGQEFDSICVCSNGWIAMGADQVMHATFRNRNIPGALGPSGMIAPFWDDLWTNSPSSSPRSEDPPRAKRVAPPPAPDPGNHLDEGGDDCASAVVIPSLPYTDTGYTCDNTNQCGSESADVFYRYTVPAGGEELEISLCASTYDTYLRVWSSCCTSQIDYDDDWCGGSSGSQITRFFNAGDIWIQVEGWSSNCGNYQLDVSIVEPPEPSGVYSYHDAANHRFIIEWSRVLKYDGYEPYPEETFECILYEPGYPVTPTGDGEILFQYMTCNNTPDVSSSNNYATVGIENLTETDGVLYSFFNQAGPGAVPMDDLLAILFTTQKIPPGAPKVPENLTAIRAGNNIELRWDAVTEDIYGNPMTVSGYNIYRDTTPEFTPGGGNYLDTAPSASYTDTGAALGDKYFYIVQATTSASVSPRGFSRKE